MKIMIVDDDPAICDMLRMLLTAKGHEVETYLDPTATPLVQRPATHCPQEARCADAMLVDYFMPNMNGLEFLKLLEERGCGAIKGNKAIITAYGTDELRRELEHLGVKYFRKPFKLPEISRWLEDCACRSAQAAATLT
jgi:CheY-like chemotaxis protein